MQDFRGRTAVITGGGNGIGRACAELFAAEGMNVVVADISALAAEEVAQSIVRAGGKALAVACDVSKREALTDLAARSLKAFGAVDLLFPNAGLTSFRQMIDLSLAEWDRIVAVNFDGVVQCIRAFLPHMIERKRGHIVATASMAGVVPSLASNHVSYSATKAAIIGLMVNLAMEARESGIVCSVVCPGIVATDIMIHSASQLETLGGKNEFKAATIAPTAAAMKTRTPAQAAMFILDGIKHDQMFIFTDSNCAVAFDEYLKEIRAGFAGAAAFERTHHLPEGGKWP